VTKIILNKIFSTRLIKKLIVIQEIAPINPN